MNEVHIIFEDQGLDNFVPIFVFEDKQEAQEKIDRLELLNEHNVFRPEWTLKTVQFIPKKKEK